MAMAALQLNGTVLAECVKALIEPASLEWEGNAAKLAEGVNALESRLQKLFPEHVGDFAAMPLVKIIVWAARMQRRLDLYQASSEPATVDLGWHTTREENMASIQSVGLLTGKEREEKRVISHFTGHENGDGIYTSNKQLQRFGTKSILVARLRAKESNDVHNDNHDTFLRLYRDGRESVVLRSSCQCVPLLVFDETTWQSTRFMEVASHGVSKLLEAIFGLSS